MSRVAILLLCFTTVCQGRRLDRGVGMRRTTTTSDNLIRAAIENNNAEYLIDEFTFNWTLNRDVVVQDRDRQLTLLGRSPYYTQRDNENIFTQGMTKRQLIQDVELWPISEKFRQHLLESLNQDCPIMVDDEFRYVSNEKLLAYTRIGFVKLHPDSDAYMVFRSLYSASFPHMPAATEKFLACAARFGAVEAQCPTSSNLSLPEWFGYKVWQRANAVTNFMGIYRSRYEAIKQNVRNLQQYLPADYATPDKCQAYPPKPEGCQAIINPEIGILIGMAQNLNLSALTASEMLKIKLLVKEKASERTPLEFFCQLRFLDQVAAAVNEWKQKTLINDRMVREITEALKSRIDGQSGDPFVIRDLIFPKEDDLEEVYFARIFAMKDDLMGNKIHMGGVFATVKPKKEVRVLDSQGPCDPRSQYCFVDLIEFSTNDALLKKYTVQKAIQSLFDHKPREIHLGQGSHIVSEDLRYLNRRQMNLMLKRNDQNENDPLEPEKYTV